MKLPGTPQAFAPAFQRAWLAPPPGRLAPAADAPARRVRRLQPVPRGQEPDGSSSLTPSEVCVPGPTAASTGVAVPAAQRHVAEPSPLPNAAARVRGSPGEARADTWLPPVTSQLP